MNCPHCNTPIDEHQVSSCLDTWVAESVLGLTELDTSMQETSLLPSGDYLISVGESRPAYEQYSSDIAAAWKILLHFTPYGSFSFSLQRWHTDNGNWHCDYAGIKATSTTQQGAPLAICRAALKAIEHERTIEAGV